MGVGPGGGLGRALVAACAVSLLLSLDQAGTGLTMAAPASAADGDPDCWDRMIQLQLSASGDWAPCEYGPLRRL